MKKSVVLLLGVMAVLCVFSIGCRKGVPMHTFKGHVAAQNAMALEDVRQAILHGGIAVNWTMRDEGPNKIIGTYHRRTHTINVEIPYDEKTYAINYQSSINLRAKDGTIHPSYNKWVEQLNNSIAQAINAARK